VGGGGGGDGLAAGPPASGVKVAVSAGPSVEVAAGVLLGRSVAVGDSCVGATVAVGGIGAEVGVGGGESTMKPRAAGEKTPAKTSVRTVVMIPSPKSRCRNR